jgi:hypothetical protein
VAQKYKQTVAKIAHLHLMAKHRGEAPDAAELDRLHAELRGQRAEDAVRRLVDSAPPLTADQLAKLSGLLSDAARLADAG